MRRTAQITERANGEGWAVEFSFLPQMVSPQDFPLVADSAGDALFLVLGEGQALALAGESNAIVVTWVPRTRIGRAAVAALTNTKHKRARR